MLIPRKTAAPDQPLARTRTPRQPERYQVNRHLDTRWRRFTASPFAADVRHGVDRSLKILGAVGILFASLLVLRGAEFAALALGLAHR